MSIREAEKKVARLLNKFSDTQGSKYSVFPMIVLTVKQSQAIFRETICYYNSKAISPIFLNDTFAHFLLICLSLLKSPI